MSMLAKFTLIGTDVFIRRLTLEQAHLVSVDGQHGEPIRDIYRHGDCYAIQWVGKPWEMTALIKELAGDADLDVRSLAHQWIQFCVDELEMTELFQRRVA